jgi:PPK2 family polyphosphate:nucleotide phosphotransferase
MVGTMSRRPKSGTPVGDTLRFTRDAEPPDPSAIPIGPAKKRRARAELADIGARLDQLQEAFYAEGAGGDGRSLLVVLQGMDTSGKGGTVRHVFGLVNPQGVRYAAFKKPTEAERRRHFLWRVRKRLPEAGEIGVFDRSHYEDVLVPRVRRSLPQERWRARCDEIRAFEDELAAAGTTVIKIFLHISPEEQLRRLRARLTKPAKRWKYDPADLEARARWGDYQAAYAEVLRETSTGTAPWFVVPADHKWYRDWAVARLLSETLETFEPRFPLPSFDVTAELAKLDSAGVTV